MDPSGLLSSLPGEDQSTAAAMLSTGVGGSPPVVPIHYPRAATLFAAVCSILFIFIGIAGNLTTIIALSRSVKLRVHATTAFIISLCVSDLLFCAINLPLTASRYIHEEWVLGDVLCQIFPFFFYGNVAVSLLNLVAITLNRYILIAHHSIYDRVYRRCNLYFMIVAMWLFAFGIMVPPLLGVWGTLGLDPQSFSCTILKKEGKSPKKFLFLMGFLLPCVMIIVCNLAIFFKVCQSRRNLAIRTTSTPNTTISSSTSASSPLKKPSSFPTVRKEDIRLAVMIAIIFLCFLLSFLPLMIVNVFDDDVVYPSVHVVASVLAWASAVVNPFVYAVTNRQYRSAYRKLFFGHGNRRGSGPSHRRNDLDHSKSNSSKTYITEFQYQASTAQVTATTPQQQMGRPSPNNRPLL